MQDYSQPIVTHKTPHKTVGFIYILPLGLLVGFIVFVAVFFFKGGGTFSLPTFTGTTPTPTAFLIAAASPTPEATATPTPVASSSAEVKKDLKIVVLNGSGTAGVAGKGRTLLEDAGYENVTTGNSNAFEYTDVTIRYSEDAAGAIPALQKVLEKEYTIETTEEADLTGSTDIEIIIGK